MKVRIVMIIMAVALIALPAMAQTQDWQSTSSMQTSGSVYSPQVTAVGATSVVQQATTTENYSPAAPRGIRRSTMGDFDDSPEGGEGSGDSPIGDAVLPLTLMALAFCGIVYLRRQKALKQ